MQPTIAVIGGTGKAGQHVVNTLLSQHFQIRLLLRNPGKYTNPAIQIIPGDARDYTAIETLLRGCDGCISTLGQSPGEMPVYSEATRHIINANKIRRYITLAGLSIDAPGDTKSEWVTAASAWMRQTYPEAMADKQQGYNLLAASTLNWTLVRVPMIVPAASPTGIQVKPHDCPGQQISGADLGAFLVAQLAETQYLKQAPFVASCG